MSQITYSRGSRIDDAVPEQRTAADFASFANAIIRDVAARKGQQYICGPLKADSSGNIRRAKDNALTRRFLAIDADTIENEEAFQALLQHLQRFECLVYTTASHTRAKPRCRVFVGLNRDVSREEGIRLGKCFGQALTSKIDPGRIKLDESAYRAEQAQFTPIDGAQHYVFDGDPLDVAAYLVEEPYAPSGLVSEIERTAREDPIMHALHRKGLLRSNLGEGKFSIDCPFKAEHTTPSSDSSTVYFIPHTGGQAHGHFDCKHAHCKSRANDEFLLALDLDPSIIRPGYTRSVTAPPAGTHKTKKFSFVMIEDLLTAPPDPDWLIEGLIEHGALTLINGEPSVGKSFLSISLAASIATGRPWNTRAVKMGKVFYIAGEGHRGLSRRLQAWRTHNGTEIPKGSIGFSELPASLTDPVATAALADAIDESSRGEPPKLIVIDTLHRNMGNGDENSAQDIGRMLNNIDIHLRTRFRCTVLIVHHSGHGDNRRARGSSSIRAAMDHEFYLDLKNGIRTLTATKNKEGTLPSPMHFELTDVRLAPSVPPLSAVLVPVSSEPAATTSRKLSAAAESVLNCLGKIPSAHWVKSDEIPALVGKSNIPDVVIHENVLQAELGGLNLSSGGGDAKRKAYQRARDLLLETNLIGKCGRYVWLINGGTVAATVH